MDKYAGDPGERALEGKRRRGGDELRQRGRVRIWALLWRTILALAILAGAVFWAMQWLADRPQRPQRQARERTFPVAVLEARPGTFAPTLGANGQILARETMEVRAQIGGVVQQVAPGLVEGGQLKAGQTALVIDDFTYRNAVAQAQLGLKDAQSGLQSAKRQLELNRSALAIAKTQVDYAARDLERAQKLAKSGSVSSKTTSDMELALEQKKQAVTQQEGAVALQEAAISRQQTALERADIGLKDAQNALEHTRILVPYDARVISANVQPGKVVAPNEVVAKLYKSDALEVKFALADTQYGPLAKAGLIGRPVAVRWQAGSTPIEAQGKIVRTGAEVQTGLGSVTVFATLDQGQTNLLRPGTFVDVSLQGAAHAKAYRLPETALYEQDHVFVRTPEGRMRPVPVILYDYDGDHVIIGTQTPLQSPVIITHLAQAGEGVKVSVEGEDPTAPQPTDAQKSGAQGAGARGAGAQGAGADRSGARGNGARAAGQDGAGRPRPDSNGANPLAGPARPGATRAGAGS